MVAIILLRRSRRERLIHLLGTDVSVASVVMLALAWSAFVFLWEPSGYYWSVLLFPAALLLTWGLRGARKNAARAWAGALVLVSVWNLYANVKEDRAYSVSYPPPLFEQIRAHLGPADVFIVAGRDWYANIDYSLLLECLDDWPRDPALPLLDDYLMKAPVGEWQKKLHDDIQGVFRSGGRVYVADHVFWNSSYDDLMQTADPFSLYAHTEYAGLDEKKLLGEIKSFFGRYDLRPSNFKIAQDPFWEVILRKTPEAPGK